MIKTTLIALILGMAPIVSMAQDCFTTCTPCNSKNQRTCCYVCLISSCSTVSCSALADPEIGEGEALFSVAGLSIITEKKKGETYLVRQKDKDFIAYLKSYAMENPELTKGGFYLNMTIDEDPDKSHDTAKK